MGAADAFLASLLGGAASQATKTLTADPALDAFAVTAAKNNLYNQIAAPILGAKFDQRTWSPTESLGVNLGQSFLGGLLGQLGQRDIERQQTAMASALPELYRSPSTFAIPEGVDVEAARQLQQSAIRENAVQEKKLQQSVIADLLTRQPEFAAIAPGLAKTAGISELGEALSKTPKDPLQDPESKEFKVRLQTSKEEDERRKEILQTPGGSALSQNLGVLPTLQTLANDNTKTSDIPFIYKFIQAQDGGVVKEGEFATVAGASPLLAQFKAQIEGALNGTSTLTPTIKNQMVREMKKVAKSQWDSLKERAEPVLKIGESRGAKREAMLPFDENYVKTILGDPEQLAGSPTLSLDLGSVKARAQAIVAKAKSGQPLTAEDRAFMEQAKSAIRPPTSSSGSPIG